MRNKLTRRKTKLGSTKATTVSHEQNEFLKSKNSTSVVWGLVEHVPTVMVAMEHVCDAKHGGGQQNLQQLSKVCEGQRLKRYCGFVFFTKILI